jgi:hypothetical protein
VWENLLEKAEIENSRWHYMRHEFASQLVYERCRPEHREGTDGTRRYEDDSQALISCPGKQVIGGKIAGFARLS